MYNLPFDKPGRFYRGNLHTHSTRSDGRLSPEAVVQFYRDMGYDFLSITDHFLEQYRYPMTDTTALRTPDFTTLIGAELHAGQTSVGEMWHILAVGLPLDFATPGRDETGPQLAARALAAGAFVACAHPAWYDLSEADVIALGDVHAIETINGIAHDHSDTIDSWNMLDALMAQGRYYLALTTDDAHFHSRHADLLHGWTWVKSEALTPEAILAALKRGEYYNSSGPMIHDVQIRAGETLRVRCSPATSIFLKGKGSRAQQVHGNGVTEAEFNLRSLRSPYCRVVVRDKHGARAWTNPIRLEGA